MGIAKTERFSGFQNEVASMAKALAHPARIAIIEHLLKTNACICGELVKQLPLAQPTVSQHIRELKKTGLIKGNTEGNAICYCIDETNWLRFGKTFQNLFSKSICLKDPCC